MFNLTPRETIILAIIIWVIYYFWSKNSQIAEKVKRIKVALKSFAKRDKIWNEAELISHANKTFQEFRDATDLVSDMEYDTYRPKFHDYKVKHLLHPDATNEVKSGNPDRFSSRSNILTSKQALRIQIIHARNSALDERDCFTACIDIAGFDIWAWGTSLRGLFSRRHIFTDFNHAKEFWTFQRHEDKWLLLSVHNAQQWDHFVNLRILDEGKLTVKKKYK